MGVYQVGQAVTITETFTVSGVASNPTTVIFSVEDPDGTTTVYTSGVDPEVTNPATGVFVLALGPLTLVGTWRYTVTGSGAVVATGSGELTVVGDPVAPQATSWPQFGPCQPWIDCGDIRAVCETEADDESLTGIAVQASQIMFELSGRQFTGVCERTVRPVNDASNGCWGGWNGVGSWLWSWDGAGWGWYGVGGFRCHCRPLSWVLLPGYPVTDITEVKIDGVAMDPSTYRLDDYRFLVRMRDPLDPNVPLFWPACQILDLDDTEPGTFSVSYRSGVSPPLAGKAAAVAMACELIPGTDCKLPTEAVRIVRAGITMERLQPLAEMLRKGMTGIPTIDSFIAAYNPNGNRRRPSVWTPDGPKYARSVGA